MKEVSMLTRLQAVCNSNMKKNIINNKRGMAIAIVLAIIVVIAILVFSLSSLLSQKAPMNKIYARQIRIKYLIHGIKQLLFFKFRQFPTEFYYIYYAKLFNGKIDPYNTFIGKKSSVNNAIHNLRIELSHSGDKVTNLAQTTSSNYEAIMDATDYEIESQERDPSIADKRQNVTDIIRMEGYVTMGMITKKFKGYVRMKWKK